MEIPKEQILDLLRQRGQADKAAQAEGELPDKVDPEQQGDLLAKLGIDPKDLLGGLGGGLGASLGRQPPRTWEGPRLPGALPVAGR